MKFKTSLITFSAISILAVQPAFATRPESQQTLIEGGTFASIAMTGAIAGGPVGMIAGAITGAFLADQTRKAYDSEIKIQKQDATMTQMEISLAEHEQTLANMEVELLHKLTFQVLFATGSDKLTELDHTRVEKLANYLKAHPNLNVNLDGHADIRGTDEYNNVLSLERAKSVKEALIASGIKSSRITHQGLGSEFAEAEKGDKEDYAKDRKVIIDIYPTDEGSDSVAQF